MTENNDQRAFHAETVAAHENCACVPEGWKFSPDENGWAIVSPSGDGCFLFDNDRLHGQTMEGAAIREVLRQLVSDLHFRSAPAAPTEALDTFARAKAIVETWPRWKREYVLVPRNVAPTEGARDASAQQEMGSGLRPTDDELWDQTLSERDRYHDIADDLAAQIAAITGVEIGEHSSANDPWRNAMLAADDFIAAQLKKLLAGPSASAQQDEREALTPFDDPDVQLVYEILCRDDAPPKGEHWEGFQARLIVDAMRHAQQVQADAAVGTAVAWRWKTQIPDEIGGGFTWSFGSHWSTGPRDRQEPLYAHPDPRLAECVEAFREVLDAREREAKAEQSYLVAEANFSSAREQFDQWVAATTAASSAENAARLLLAKVQAAKEEGNE